MRFKQVIAIALLLLVCSAGLALAQDPTQVQDTFYSKSDIEQVVVRNLNGTIGVYLLLNKQIGDFEGFYYYDFASLQEALEFALWMSKGKIKGVQHYRLGTGKTAGWGSKTIAVISRWYFFNN